MDSKQLISRALKKEFLSADEGQFLFQNTPTADLMFTANELKKNTNLFLKLLSGYNINENSVNFLNNFICKHVQGPFKVTLKVSDAIYQLFAPIFCFSTFYMDNI